MKLPSNAQAWAEAVWTNMSLSSELSRNFQRQEVDHWESRLKKNEASGNSCLQIQTQWTALVVGKPVTSEEGNSHLVSPSSCVGQAVFGLISAPWALAVFCARLQTKSKGHFSRYYKSAVKTRQRVILLFLGLLVSSFLPLLVFSYLSPNPFPIQREGTQD